MKHVTLSREDGEVLKVRDLRTLKSFGVFAPQDDVGTVMLSTVNG